MQTFESTQLYIDFSRLPPPKVIEEIDYEELLSYYKSDVLAKRPELAQALGLEQSPTNVILEAQSYAEMIVRSRINSAARAVMLPFSTGADLDNLGANLNVVRLDGETDARFRRRIQLAPETFSTAGSQGSYVWHAMSADVSIKDVSATQTRPGRVEVRVMNSGDDPTPTEAQLEKVREALRSTRVKPLTDMVRVAPVTVVETDLVASVSMYPGPSQGAILADIQASLTRLRDRVSFIGRDLMKSAIHSALYQEGVHNITIQSPTADLIMSHAQVVKIKSVKINFESERLE